MLRRFKMEEFCFRNTRLWAEYVVNNLGCNNLSMQYMYLNKKEDVISSTRISYWSLAHKNFDDHSGIWNLSVEDLYPKLNNCSGVDIISALDFDEGTYGEYLDLINQIDNDGLKFIAYSAGKRCRHIHIFFPKLRHYSVSRRKEFKLYLINKYGCDCLKASDSSNIPICYPALEGCEPLHWKTQMPIKVVFKNV